MASGFIQSTHLGRSQFAEYERVAGFLLETFERERRLNVEALCATPPAATALLCAMHSLFLLPWSWLAISASEK